MNLWDTMIGHDWAIDLLKGALTQNRVGHAYLFTGVDQIGKTTLALMLAQALNCLAEDVGQRPCGECRSCQLIAGNRHPDVRLIEPEQSSRGKLTIKIETIRQLQQDLNLAAYEARYKIAILKRFDSATIGATNAFLKTLEEPPSQVILMLTATDAEAMLPTISSRCHTLALRPLPQQIIAQVLRTRWDVESAQANVLSHLANGRLGWAIAAHQDPTILEERTYLLAFLHQILTGDVVVRFGLADSLAKTPETLPATLQTWLTWWRDMILLTWQGEANDNINNIDQLPALQNYAQQWSRQAIQESLKQTKEAIWQLQYNANTKLVIENLLLTYPTTTP